MSDHHKPEIDEVSGVETTGHSWDGIKELNNPLPRWWLWVFYACIAWAIVYMVLMPAIPGLPGAAGATKGLRGESDRINVTRDLAALDVSRAPFFARLTGADLAAIEADPELLRFALAAGESAFGDNCATCHGSGAQGFKGYPNLNDDVWIWGGTLDDIKQTLMYGIRTEHPDTRFSQMPAYGRDGLLTGAQISDVAHYVMALGGREEDAAAAARGAETYARECVTCHTAAGTGDRLQGAPSLVDADWLYGSSHEELTTTIARGPYGVMPFWSERLDEPTIDALAVYVHALGGGEDG